ncbi:MAG: S46 family peptidase, partial [Myxococcales bacterium]|nr:S46 family peptidase [Myxococcales bacterium]
RLKTASEVADATTWGYPRRIARYEQYLAVLDQVCGNDEELKIKASPRIRGLGNGLTNAKGMLEG